MAISKLILSLAVTLAMLGACGPAEEVPEPQGDPMDQSPDREDPGDVPEADPDTPDDPGTDPLYR